MKIIWFSFIRIWIYHCSGSSMQISKTWKFLPRMREKDNIKVLVSENEEIWRVVQRELHLLIVRPTWGWPWIWYYMNYVLYKIKNDVCKKDG